MRTSALAALQEAQKALKGQRPGSLGDVFLRLYFSIFDRKKQQDWPGSCSVNAGLLQESIRPTPNTHSHLGHSGPRE